MTDLMPPKNVARIPIGLELPQLIQVQLDSFQRLKDEGLKSLFNEVSPIVSYGNDLRLHFPSDTPHLTGVWSQVLVRRAQKLHRKVP
jgi:DNA-directed RNA polymerase, beta subunit/140 kD subunit